MHIQITAHDSLVATPVRRVAVVCMAAYVRGCVCVCMSSSVDLGAALAIQCLSVASASRCTPAGSTAGGGTPILRGRAAPYSSMPLPKFNAIARVVGRVDQALTFLQTTTDEFFHVSLK